MKSGAKKITFVLSAIFVVFVTGNCVHAPLLEPVSIESVDPVKKSQQNDELTRGERYLIERKWTDAEAVFKEFNKKYPYSVYMQRSRFGLAQSLAEQGNWSEAAEVYRLIINTSQLSNPEIKAQALFEISFCYENLGEEAKVLASLQDALSLKEYLVQEKVLAEIPARMAASYYRLGQNQIAEEYLQKADEGIKRLRALKLSEGDNTWLAKIYFRMGVFSTNQLSSENLETSLDTLRIVQIFSLRSAEEGVAPWSSDASDRLIDNYRTIWRLIGNLAAEEHIDSGMAKSRLQERQIDLTNKLLEITNDLKLYQLPSGSNKTEATAKVYAFIEELTKQAQVFLASRSVRNHLTPEAEALGGLKR